MNRDSEYLALLKEAESENTSGDRLKELVALDDNLAEIVASNITAPSDLLIELASLTNKAVIKAVVSNPNTPVETLLKLGEYFPQELLDNPILDILYLENPNFIKNIPWTTLYALLQKENVQTLLLNHIKESYQNNMVMEALKMHVVFAGEMNQGWHEIASKNANCANLSFYYPQFLQRLDLDFLSYLVEFVPKKILDDTTFRMVLARNCKTSTILEELAGDRHTSTKTNVAGNRNTPANVLRELADYSVVETREAVARNESASADALQKLAKDKTDKIREAVAGNEKTPLNTLKKLATDNNEEIREIVARNWSTPASLLNQLATDKAIEVRQEVAYSPNVSVNTLKQLAVDNNDKVRKSVAGNWDTPLYLLEQLATDKSSEVRKNVARNGNTPTHTLDKLARDKDSTVRAGVAGNPNIPLFISERLSNDLDSQVREAFVGFWNQNPPIEILQELVTHPDELIRRKVAYSHKSPLNILEALATDKNYWVRETVAGNKNTPIHILKKLAEDEDAIVRAGVAERENLPSCLLKQLANDEYSRVRCEVAKNPNTPIETLIELARDRDNSVYYEVVKNPQCTLKIKETIFKNIAKSKTPSFLRFVLFLSDYAESSVLAQNSNSISWLERYAIACNQKTPKDTIKQLAQDGNRIVRATAKESLEKR